MKTAKETMNAPTLTTAGTQVFRIGMTELRNVFPCTHKMRELSLDGNFLLFKIIRYSDGLTNNTKAPF